MHAQLVPRLNPFPSPPPTPADSRARERDRLLHRLAFYGLSEKEVLGDGNCQVAATAEATNLWVACYCGYTGPLFLQCSGVEVDGCCY